MDAQSNVVSLCLEPLPMMLHFSDAQLASDSLRTLDVASQLSRSILERCAEFGGEAAALRVVRDLFAGAAYRLEQLADGSEPSMAEALASFPGLAHLLEQPDPAALD